MQYILLLLPLLACPLGMGLMVWMMRGKKEQTPQETGNRAMHTPNDLAVRMNESPKRSSIFTFLGMCLDWRVLIGLAVVGLAVWVIAPKFLLATIPLLILAACPLSMLFMMRGMHKEEQVLPASDTMSTREEHLATLKHQRDSISAQIVEMEHPEIPILSEIRSRGDRASAEQEEMQNGKRNW